MNHNYTQGFLSPENFRCFLNEAMVLNGIRLLDLADDKEPGIRVAKTVLIQLQLSDGILIILGK
ncbi:MAG: hypothetical protein WD824_23625 [Cyclobacteriaceae bacterium]